MRDKDFEYLYGLEERFWWFVAMRSITDTIAGKELAGKSLQILDAGCGTGYNVSHYEHRGHSVFALDVASEAIAGVRKRGLRKVCQASVTHIPYSSATFDLVLSFEVVSQIPGPGAEAAIREMHRVLRPGGHLFARVPAFEWLRSSHDDDLQTARRYRREEFQRKLEALGFDVEFATYANFFLFPVVLLRRSLKRFGLGKGSDVKPLPAGLSWLDPIFRRVLGAEARLLGSGKHLPFGLSVICYARKR